MRETEEEYEEVWTKVEELEWKIRSKRTTAMQDRHRGGNKILRARRGGKEEVWEACVSCQHPSQR